MGSLGRREIFFASGLRGLGGYVLGSVFRFGCSGSRISSQNNYSFICSCRWCFIVFLYLLLIIS